MTLTVFVLGLAVLAYLAFESQTGAAQTPAYSVDSSGNILDSSGNIVSVAQIDNPVNLMSGNLTQEQSSIASIVTATASNLGLDPTMSLNQAIAESGLNANAVGPNTRYGTAKGVMQLLDSTAAQFGVTNIFDPTQNILAGLTYMEQLLSQFGSYPLALAAYNWGPGNLQKCVTQYGADWFFHIPAETQNYVTKISGYAGV